ncbi:MAG: TraB/GumN family protein [Oscillospiraceae bacterium]|nr:TraB/GumN family protein [Oscillospiraceae bacterium]
MKKSLFLFMVCILLLSGCKSTKASVTPPFWEVYNEESGGRVYLLGSMHVGLDAEYPESVVSAFEESDIIACEVDTVKLTRDSARLAAAMELMKCPEGVTAEECFGESYAEIRDFCKDKRIYNSAYDSYLPTVWSSLITSKTARDAGYSTEYGTETVFLNLAKRQGKQIYEIESAEFQYGLNAAQPMALQVYNVQSAVSDYDGTLEQVRELYRAWSDFDGAALESLCSAENIPEELSEEYTEFYQAMYTDRQENMAEYITECLKGGETVFVMAGAMHYYAEPDILTLLEREGYTAVSGY